MDKRTIGVFVGIVPMSWRFGKVRAKLGIKYVYGCGPFRLAIHWIEVA